MTFGIKLKPHSLGSLRSWLVGWFLVVHSQKELLGVWLALFLHLPPFLLLYLISRESGLKLGIIKSSNGIFFTFKIPTTWVKTIGHYYSRMTYRLCCRVSLWESVCEATAPWNEEGFTIPGVCTFTRSQPAGLGWLLYFNLERSRGAAGALVCSCFTWMDLQFFAELSVSLLTLLTAVHGFCSLSSALQLLPGQLTPARSMMWTKSL